MVSYLYLNILYRFKRNIKIESGFSEEFTNENFMKSIGYVFIGYLIVFASYVSSVLFEMNKYVVFDNGYIVAEIAKQKSLLINFVPLETMRDPVFLVIYLIHVFQFGILFLIIQSIIVWIIALFVNFLSGNEMSAGMCYVLGQYSVTVANILLVLLLLTHTFFEAYIFIHLIITVRYVYKFTKDRVLVNRS